MSRVTFLLLTFLLQGVVSYSQSNTQNPKLVVGIVVDQMRFDHLYMYQEKYSENGFKRIMTNGFNFKNAHYNYIPTVTAAGHTSIYTGTTPSMHGVIGNSWYVRELDKSVGSVDDANEKTVGSKETNDNGRSPRHLLTTTITDQLRMGTNFKSKVISVSFKDRGAILPGGRTANGAYWHDWQTSSGHFVTSSYYMDELPKWVKDFNNNGKASDYLNKEWNTLYPIETYTESYADNNTFERVLSGKETPTFPYDFKSLRKTYKELKAEYQLLWVSPWGNTLLTDFAIEAIEKEALGTNSTTDFLNISYSVTDAAGHAFGPQAIEIEDIYLRLDRDIENLLNYLDATVGKDAYTLFLTSDHGVMPVVSHLYKSKLPSGTAIIPQYEDSIKLFLNKRYGENLWIQKFGYEHLYLNRTLIADQKLDLNDFQQVVADYLITLEGIQTVQTAHQLRTNEYTSGIRRLLQNGYHPKLSGDLLIAYQPGWQLRSDDKYITEIQGATHGSGYAYDTHVPLLWYGSGIPVGESIRRVAITDISPSLAMKLNLQLPSGSTGVPLTELFEVDK